MSWKDLPVAIPNELFQIFGIFLIVYVFKFLRCHGEINVAEEKK